MWFKMDLKAFHILLISLFGDSRLNKMAAKSLSYHIMMCWHNCDSTVQCHHDANNVMSQVQAILQLV